MSYVRRHNQIRKLRFRVMRRDPTAERTTDYLNSPRNPLGSLAATITAPFIQRNQVHFATALARTQYDQAVLRFEKSLSQA
jgi:hypothetical protein